MIYHYKPSPNDIIQIKQKLLTGSTVKTLHKEFAPNLKVPTFTNILRKYDLVKWKWIYQRQRNRNIIEDLLTKRNTLPIIAKKYGLNSTSSIERIIALYKVKRPDAFNIHCFDNPQTESELYFLGLLFADGCVSKDKKGIGINLTKPSIDLLYKYKEFLKTPNPVRLDKLGLNKNSQDSYRVLVSSKYLNKQLTKLGCVPMKTYYLKFPKWLNKLNDKQIKHFIRGYFDGNGSFILNQKNYTQTLILTISSTKPFLLGLKKILQKKFKCHLALIKNGKRKHNWDKWSGWLLSITTTENSAAIGKWLYKDATIYEKNKRKKFFRLLKYKGIK